jgi:hypothetical protein
LQESPHLQRSTTFFFFFFGFSSTQPQLFSGVHLQESPHLHFSSLCEEEELEDEDEELVDGHSQ